MIMVNPLSSVTACPATYIYTLEWPRQSQMELQKGTSSPYYERASATETVCCMILLYKNLHKLGRGGIMGILLRQTGLPPWVPAAS